MLHYPKKKKPKTNNFFTTLKFLKPHIKDPKPSSESKVKIMIKKKTTIILRNSRIPKPHVKTDQTQLKNQKIKAKYLCIDSDHSRASESSSMV